MKTTAVKSIRSCSVLLMITFFVTGCSTPAVPSSETPQSAVIEDFSIPFDSTKKRFVLYVGDLKIPATEVHFKSYGRDLDSTCLQYAGNSVLITNSLLSSLAKVGNFSVLDRYPRGTHFNPLAGEIGPFEINASVTEFNSLAEVSESGNASLTRIEEDDPAITTMAKAFAQSPLFIITSLTGLPTQWSNIKTVGVIGLEILIIEPKSKRILSSFPVYGRFSGEQVEVGTFLSGYHSKDSAASVMQGAIRMASQEAAKRIFSELAKLNP